MLKHLLHAILIIALAPTLVLAQKKEKIKYKADVLEVMRKDGEMIRKLKNNVVFTQQGTRIYCDSSYFYPAENRMVAFGYVRIYDGDVTITADNLRYDGNERKSYLRDNVVYTSGTRVLYTDFLDYDLTTKVSNFFNNGRLVDQNTVLTSEKGIFYSEQNYAIFRNDVLLVSPEYTLKSDTLRYNTATKIAKTPGRTHIVTPSGVTVDAKGGEYLTDRQITEFAKGEVETRDYIMRGDVMYLNDKEKFYTAKGNVKMTAKNQDVIIVGDEGQHFKNLGYSKIYGNPVMKKILELDTFYLSADTLYAIESEILADKRILAYHNVKVFKLDLQGKADSLAYFLADSVIRLYNDPVLWSNNSQITSDSIKLLIKNNIVDKMFLNKNAFIASEDSLKQYNQVKGRNMVAQFDANTISEITVNGNGESLYYILSENDTLLVGLNKMLCSDMVMRFANNDLDNITFYKNPESKLIPPHEILKKDTQLEGFSWRIAERPALFDVAHYLKPKLNQQKVDEKQQASKDAIEELVQKPKKINNEL
jgi:lipopolysaccharide export system protein LptA